MTTPQIPLIVTHNLYKEFSVGGDWITVLDEINLDIPPGQFIAIMGPSGSGKSTLLYLLGGLEPASDGEIIIKNRSLNILTGNELASFRSRMIGFIFQSFHLIPTLSALENVSMPGLFAGLGRDVREERATQLLERMGLSDRLYHRPAQLSGGQQQRVAIARALFNNPPIIMADEPTGALDSANGLRVMQLLRSLCDDYGKTLILVTHDPSAAAYAQRIIELKDGRIIHDVLTGESTNA